VTGERGAIRGDLACDDVRELAAAYVLDALEPAEAAAVRTHLADCPEAHAELAELGGVVAYLAETVEPIEPPARLRGRLLAAAEAERAAELERSMPEPNRGRSTEPIPLRRPRAGASGWLLRVAAVLAIVALGTWNVLLQAQVGQLRDNGSGLEAVLAAAAEPGSRLAIMTGEPASVRGVAVQRANGSLVLSIEGLAPTSDREVYETWVIVGGNAPIPVGGFEVTAGTRAAFSSRPGPSTAGAVIALTLEPAPGATAPTLPIVASGVATEPATGR
jgi:anti-sigma factor RsiW